MIYQVQRSGASWSPCEATSGGFRGRDRKNAGRPAEQLGVDTSLVEQRCSPPSCETASSCLWRGGRDAVWLPGSIG